MKNRKRVRIDKDYCSSVVWHDGCNCEEEDFNFNTYQLFLSKIYDTLWEKAREDYENVEVSVAELAEVAKFTLLEELHTNRKDIEWVYWDEDKRCEVVYGEEK